MIAPKLWHIVQSIELPNDFLANLQRKLTGFIWKNGKHWTTADVTVAPVKEGGLGLIDIQRKVLSFRFQTMQTLVFAKGKGEPWKRLATYFLGTNSVEDIGSRLCSSISGSIDNKSKDIYGTARKVWKKLQIKEAPEENESQFHMWSTRSKRKMRLPIPKRSIHNEILYAEIGKKWSLPTAQEGIAINWMSLWKN